MVDNRKSLLESASILGSNLSKIGAQIKENKIEARKQKVLESFNNPDKIFFNPDGSSKDPIETRSKVTNGAMELLMLGDKNLASGLLNYYGEVEKNLTRRATNQAYRNILGDKGQVLNGADADRVDTTKFGGTLIPKDPYAGKRNFSVFQSEPFKYKDPNTGKVRWVREYKEYNPLKNGEIYTHELRDVNDPSKRYNISNSHSYTYHDGPRTTPGSTIVDKNNNIIGTIDSSGRAKDLDGNILTQQQVNDKGGVVRLDGSFNSTPSISDKVYKKTQDILKLYPGEANQSKRNKILKYLNGGEWPDFLNPGEGDVANTIYNIREGKYEFSR